MLFISILIFLVSRGNTFATLHPLNIACAVSGAEGITVLEVEIIFINRKDMCI